MYSIYVHRVPDGKVYVGCTSKSIQERRWLGYCGRFGEIVKKYGWKQITTEILATAETQEESVALENHYIQLYKADNPEFGYNMLKGIGGVPPLRTRKLSESARKAHSNAETHRKLCEAQKIAQNRPEVKALKSESSKIAMTKPGMHEKLSESAKNAWNDPEIRERFIKSHLGKKWVHLGDKSKQIKPDLLADYLSQGWELGRAPYQRIKREENQGGDTV